MKFQDWYDNLGPHIPHGHVAQMKMAWDAAIEAARGEIGSLTRYGCVGPEGDYSAGMESGAGDYIDGEEACMRIDALYAADRSEK